ncbi:class I SAM-dependent methyltransferase [Oceanirhabdus sp. W0125-5]|uniref:class I SAM-dependent methyltransferase n=1 Tax=Oceanirhabdus sp. W0125-5 TaxID=2999116 RepID=UPI0022F2E6E1|nr:class I SAM-dependent methyltransferase [Oceanirhabdus sp. W0125-5]WBW96960.1 class I SAM-dependent methyltransferase [Oceanirhabdus sp. W0125-5]
MNEQKRKENPIIGIWDRASKNFGKVGPKYWSYFGERLVEQCDINSGQTVLDIGCGVGASLIPAAKKIGIDGHAVGIDLSSGMVEECINNVKVENLHNIDVSVMDANKLEFEDNKFDYILNGFGFPYLYFGDKNFSEVRRVLKDNGKFACVTWAMQEDTKWITEVVQRHLNDDKNEIKKDNKNENQEKTIDICSSEGVRTTLEEAGFKEIKVSTEEKLFTYTDKEEWWNEMWANAVRGILEKIQDRGEDYLLKFKEEAFQGLEQFRTEEGITFKRFVIYGIANN